MTTNRFLKRFQIVCIIFPSQQFTIDDCHDILTEEEEWWGKRYQAHVAVKNFLESLEGLL